MPSLLRLDLQAVQAVAHHLDQVTADLTLERSVRNWVDLLPDRQTHDYAALQLLHLQEAELLVPWSDATLF